MTTQACRPCGGTGCIRNGEDSCPNCGGTGVVTTRRTKYGIAVLMMLMIGPSPASSAPVSKVGQTIEVENYRCTVRSSYRIECIDIGPVCVKQRAEEKVMHDYYFGCALDGWKKGHPTEKCPDLDKRNLYWPSCWPMSIGRF